MKGLRVPVVYIGEKRCDNPKILGIQFKFIKGIPQNIELRFVNLLKNRGNYVDAGEHMIKHFADPGKVIDRVLVARTLHSLGDMLYATLTPKAIKLKMPHVKVDILVPQESIPIWQHNPWVDSIYACDAGNKPPEVGPYGVYFDITRPCVMYEHYTSVGPSKKSRIDIYMEHCGAQMSDPAEKKPIYTITEEDRAWAREETKNRFFLGVQLRANSPDRNWMPGQGYDQKNNKAIIHKWLSSNKNVDVMLLDPHESFLEKYSDNPRMFKAAGYNTRQMMALYERCVVAMTLNSGLLVAAGALSIPQVTLFGNINPDSRTPYLPNVIPIWHPEFCPHGISPCWGGCEKSYCMERIPVGEVWNAIEATWSGPGKARLEQMKFCIGGSDVEPTATLQKHADVHL